MLALQRDAHVFERGQMRKYRRNLKRADQPEPRHVGRRHRGDVLALVANLPARRLQEFGQQIETGGLAGAVRPDQRVDTAATHLERDVANGKETGEFLGQSAGFEDELIGQIDSPIRHRREAPRPRGQLFSCPTGCPHVLETVRGLSPPGRNMPSSAAVTQGGKLCGAVSAQAVPVDP